MELRVDEDANITDTAQRKKGKAQSELYKI
jgi:hypothetical protein